MDSIEVYVLCGDRTSNTADRFLTSFASSRTPAAIDFPFPEYADIPEVLFTDTPELIRQLEFDRRESYSIYWNVVDGISDQAMLFFTKDGGMIAGLGGLYLPPKEALLSLQDNVDGKFGYVTSGSCPPGSMAEFILICEHSTLPNLFNGDLYLPDSSQ